MIVHVRLFAAARQLAAVDRLPVRCPDPATLADVRVALARDCPNLAPLLPHVRFAVNARYVLDSQPVTSNDDVACIPPVSGG